MQAFFDWLGDLFAPVGKLLRWIGHLMPDAPYARIILWLLLIAAATWVLWLLYQHLFPQHVRQRRALPSAEAETDEGRPDIAAARGWLQEADALAAEGRYGEAVHHLLIRSIEDVGKRRPQLLRPAITSRDIAAASAIPAVPRTIFARIAALVVRILLCGQPVGHDDWSACRAAYSDFAEKRIWSR